MSKRTPRLFAKLAVADHRAKQHAKHLAQMECFALLTMNDPLKNLLADGNWEEASKLISDVVVEAYQQTLEKA